MASVSTRSISRHTPNITPDAFASSTDSQIETLYSLPDARIVEFKPPSLYSSLVRNNDTATVDAEPGTLSWASKYERTIAVGYLRIYRAPGSVAFLNCQNAVRPILPKSQAWCVDGISKFVLRSPPLFWRIEVPSNSPAELQRVEELKKVLDKILRFDKTPCPFERHFTIELPEPPSTPTRKKPERSVNQLKEKNKRFENLTNTETDHSKIAVKRVPTRTPSLPSLSDKLSTMTKIQPKTNIPPRNLASNIPSVPVQLSEKNLKLHNKTELDGTSMIFGSVTPEFHEISYQKKIKDELGNELDKICPLLSSNHFESTPESPTDQYMSSPLFHNSGRSSMVSPFISMITSPSFKHSNYSSRNITISKDCESEVSSSGSFYSSQSWHPSLDLLSVENSHGPENITYPYPHDCICGPVGNDLSRNDSRSVKAPVSAESWNGSSDGESNEHSLCSNPKTPTLTDDRSEKSDDDCHEITTPFQPKSTRICHGSPKRIGSKMKRPSVSSLSLAGSRKMLQMAHQLPTAIIQKTFGALLSPPTHLCHLMLRIASRIAAGEWRGMLSNYGELVHWDFEDEYGDDEQDEELNQSLSISVRDIKKAVFSNWEVD